MERLIDAVYDLIDCVITTCIAVITEVRGWTEEKKMCEYQRINTCGKSRLPICTVTGEWCTFCVYGNSDNYIVGKLNESSQEVNQNEVCSKNHANA